MHKILDAVEYTAGIVIPAWVLRTSEMMELEVTAAFFLVWVSYRGYRVGRDAHPDRKAWKDRPPGFSRVMMRWETEYHTEMQAREQSEVVSYSEWLNAKESRGQRLREWLDNRGQQ